MTGDRQPCEWCGGMADPATTCPRSIDCPECKGRASGSCYRPSGHRASQLHASRVAFAERQPPHERKDRTMTIQLGLDGRETRLQAPPAANLQAGLFDMPPASTFDTDAPELIAGQLDLNARTHEPMRNARVRRRGEWS